MMESCCLKSPSIKTRLDEQNMAVVRCTQTPSLLWISSTNERRCMVVLKKITHALPLIDPRMPSLGRVGGGGTAPLKKSALFHGVSGAR